MGAIKIKRRDYIWSYLGMFFRLGVNIILLPLVLKFLSDEELGLWYVYISISSLVALLDFGFAPALARNISYVWCGADSIKKEDIEIIHSSNTNYDLLKSLLNTCKYIYCIIAIVSIVLLLTIGSYYIVSISNGHSLASWIIYSIGVFFNVIYGYYSTFLRGVGAVAECNVAAVVSRLVQIFITIPLLLLGYGIIGVSISYLLSGFALRFYSRYSFFRYDNIGTKIKHIKVKGQIKKSLDLFKKIWYNASKDGIVTIANYLSTYANTLISSAVIGLSSTGSYGVAVQLAGIISTLASVPFSTNQPAMQEKSIKGDTDGSKKIFATSMSLYCISFILLSVSLICVLPVICWIKPNFKIDIWMLSTILLFNCLYNFYHLCCSYISTFNKLPYTYAFIITAIVSVLLSYLLAKYLHLGLWALILAPLGASLAYNTWRWPIYVFRNILQTSLTDFVKIGYMGSKEYVKSFIKH